MKVFCVSGFDKKCRFLGTPTPVPFIHVDNKKNYDYFRNGVYLDMHDDAFAPANKEIRMKNFSFLDQINSSSNKIDFMDYFNSITKFPNLKKVSENIENEFIRMLKEKPLKLQDRKFDVIVAGFDQNCSVGKKLALPGSDVDKPFVVLRGVFGENSTNKNKEIVDEFNTHLWTNTDQRILSYNHNSSFPVVYTVDQIDKILKKIDPYAKELNYNHEKWMSLIENEYKDLMKAAEFNILLSQNFPQKEFNQSSNIVDREMLKNFAYIIETIRDGKKVFVSPDYEIFKTILVESPFYRYSNIAQLKALENSIASGQEQKQKIIKRKSLEKEFATWNTDKQFRFIKTLVKYISGDEDDFFEYFKNDYDMADKYQPLFGKLCHNDESINIYPNFAIQGDKVDIYIRKKPTSLYQGYNSNVLWIDKPNSNSIVEKVLLHLEKLFQIPLFKNVNRVQTTCANPPFLPKNFREIAHYTADGVKIIERIIK